MPDRFEYFFTDKSSAAGISINIRGEPMVNTRSDADRFEQLYSIHVYS